MNKQELLNELRGEGFSEFIIRAFSKVPRENFITKELKLYAYDNEPLPIGKGATISQPYTIAFMLDLLELDKLKSSTPKLNISNTKQDKLDEPVSEESQTSKRSQTIKINKSFPISNNNINKIKILEIGSGCGYVLALINQLCPNVEIYGIEILSELVKKSKHILKNDKNIHIINTDGSRGLLQEAPFDRILISAACDKIPNHLFKQLKRRSGILVCPVRNSIYQIKKKSHGIIANEFPGFVFVPLMAG